MKIRIGLWLGVILAAVLASAENSENTEETGDLNQTFFISEIFNKYGNNNIMTYEGFEHLLENLGIGKLKFETKHDVSLHKVNGTFREFHDELSLHRHNHDESSQTTEKPSRRKRNLKTEDNITLKKKCLTAQDILTTFGLKPYHEVVISPSKYLQMCPAIVYELDQKLCQEEDEDNMGRKQGEQHLVWIYASISIFVMGASGMLCVLAVPLIKKNYYSRFLQFLVSLAVGTLCGDALIHLIPQLKKNFFLHFIILIIEWSVLDLFVFFPFLWSRNEQRAALVNFLFFGIPTCLRANFQVFSTNGKPGSEVIIVLRGTVTLLAVYFFFIIENVLKGMQNKKRKNAENEKESVGMLSSFETHGHSHGGDGIKTVAWMAIMGDILHNVTDGLSIGAAFQMSLSTGFASSIAIFCHELPHELGDYAILLSSGMSVKKSLFYNVVSSVFSFAGMVGGVLLGEIKDAILWINAFTAGSFLYIALSDLVPEMKSTQTNSSFISFVIQTVGFACGGILMFAIALYEDQIEQLLC